MEITFGGIFIIIFVSSRPRSVSGLVIKTGTFQSLQQHPQLKECTLRFLYENEYFGCRVSELTGQCEGLTYSWGLNPIKEQGYAYAKKVFVKENFQPPGRPSKRLRLVSHFDRGDHSWKIPVVLDTGSKLDIFMSIPNWHLINEIKKEFIDMEYTIGNGTGLNIVGYTRGTRLSALASPKEMFKISLLAQPYALAMFVDDKEVATLKLSTHIRIMRQIFAHRKYSSVDPILVHGIKFKRVLE